MFTLKWMSALPWSPMWRDNRHFTVITTDLNHMQKESLQNLRIRIPQDVQVIGSVWVLSIHTRKEINSVYLIWCSRQFHCCCALLVMLQIGNDPPIHNDKLRHMLWNICWDKHFPKTEQVFRNFLFSFFPHSVHKLPQTLVIKLTNGERWNVTHYMISSPHEIKLHNKHTYDNI